LGKGMRTVMSGPLVEDDGQTMNGSLFVIEAEDRKAVEDFHHRDPFYLAGVWERVTITAYIKRVG